MNKKQIILNFLQTQHHMIIATVNGQGKPEAAFVGFAESDDLSLIFGTSTASRKYRNIQIDNYVAIVFGSEKGITVQYEGTASSLIGEELLAYKKMYFTKMPSSQKYENNKDQNYLKITPNWLGYTDYAKEEIEIFDYLPTPATATTESSS